MRRFLFVIMSALVLFYLSVPCVAWPGDSVKKKGDVVLTIVYNNVAGDPKLKTAWGMAAVVETGDRTILFDTGGEGSILLSNMQSLNISPKDIGVVFLSHNHWDHTGGLDLFLKKNPNIKVFAPSSFASSLSKRVTSVGGECTAVHDHKEICDGVYSTGELGSSIKEQSLVIKTSQGLVIVTGCSHPGIVTIARKASDLFGDKIYLISGGFHLKGESDKEIGEVIDQLRALGVKKIGPSHCTGERAMELFKDAWGEDFIHAGVGARIEVKR